MLAVEEFAGGEERVGLFFLALLQFQSLCQLIYIATIADKLQIDIVASDAEKQTIIANPLAIKSLERWLELDSLVIG